MKKRDKVRVSEGLFRTMFERGGADPAAWRAQADSLLRAADALKPLIEADLHAAGTSATEMLPPMAPVYMLLSGLAIETLAKARIVAGHPSPTYAGSLAKDLKTHDLIDLLARAGITLTDDESYLVERLEVFLWAGRYPIPVKFEDFLPRTAPQGGWGPMSAYSSSDPSMIKALAERLSDD